MKNIFTLLIILTLTSVSGCTTTTYGKSFTQISETPDRYSIKVYSGGFAFKGTATEKVKKECEEYIASTDYKSYKIISSKFELIPSGTSFIVEFE